MGAISVTRTRTVGREQVSRSQVPAQRAQRSRLGQVAKAVMSLSQHALESWCGSEAELRDSGALTDERVRAVASLAMSGEQPFPQ